MLHYKTGFICRKELGERASNLCPVEANVLWTMLNSIDAVSEKLSMVNRCRCNENNKDNKQKQSEFNPVNKKHNHFKKKGEKKLKLEMHIWALWWATFDSSASAYACTRPFNRQSFVQSCMLITLMAFNGSANLAWCAPGTKPEWATNYR